MASNKRKKSNKQKNNNNKINSNQKKSTAENNNEKNISGEKQEKEKEIINNKDNIEKKNPEKQEINKEVNKKSNSKKSNKIPTNKENHPQNSEAEKEKSLKNNEEKDNAKKENKSNKNTNHKKEEQKQDLKEESKPKESKTTKIKNETKEDEKPEYVEEFIRNKKKKLYIIINIGLIVFVILIFSTIFALINLGKTTFAKGTKIKGIDISNLTVEEARNKVNEALNIELIQDMDLKYNEEFEMSFDTSQIEYTYSIDAAINEAFNIGRDGNIIENNYKLLLTAFLGKNIKPEYTYNEEALDYIINDIASKIPNLVVQPTHYIEGEELIINRGTDGIKVETEKLKKEILSAIEERSAEKIILDSSNQTVQIPVKQVSADKIDIEKIYNEIYTEPQDAYYIENPFQIFVEVDGIDFAITIEEAKKLISSETKEEYSIPLKITPPQRTINDIGTEAFPYLISSFTTKYDASNKNRSTNLAIAAEKINGTVLMPGDVFSFNKIVGKRTVEDGYTNAKIYANGQVVDGLAGGICQISSTLYNAVLLANLEIVERRNHSFRTSYVPAGRDATVVYGTTDFQFKNSRTYPIKIEASVGNGIAEFKVYGITEEVEYEIKIIPITTQSIPYTVQYIQDGTLPSGAQVTVQSGSSGCKTTTYRELRLNGAVVSKELLSNDTYNPLQAVIRIGP